MATYANLFIDQGSDFSTFVDIEGEDGTSLDLTDLSLKGQIRKSYGSSNAFDFSISKVDAEGGQIRLLLDSSVSDSMSIGRYVYDVYAENNVTNERFKIIEGILEIVPRVTQFS